MQQNLGTHGVRSMSQRVDRTVMIENFCIIQLPRWHTFIERNSLCRSAVQAYKAG
jgi:hypothetical protein